MTDLSITTTQITLAAIDMPAMVQFYTAVFALDLHPVAAYGTTLYRGTLAATDWVLCPNDLANVQADQSRHQLTYAVSDLAAILARVQAAGGTVQDLTPTPEQPTSAVVRDPDGNSLVFLQAHTTA